MLQLDPKHSSFDVENYLESDETPVDSEDQNWIPNLLLSSLLLLWAHLFSWFFAVDMGIYSEHLPEAIVPDAFLALGVPRRTAPHGRLSYIVRNEQGIVPIWVLEMVSQTYRQEYSHKKDDYATLGVLYYVVYNPGQYGPKREQHDRLEVYRLEEGIYRRLPGDPVWMPEIGLGIGTGHTLSGGIEIECLVWTNERGQPYPHVEELAEQQTQRAEQEKQRADQAEDQIRQTREQVERLTQRLRELGIDSDL